MAALRSGRVDPDPVSTSATIRTTAIALPTCHANASIIPGPSACLCCGSLASRQARRRRHGDAGGRAAAAGRSSSMSARSSPAATCETISQAPSPFHVIARAHAGPSLLAMILHAKFALHQPLNRQSETYAREGIDSAALDPGRPCRFACATVLAPLADLIRAHVLAGGAHPRRRHAGCSSRERRRRCRPDYGLTSATIARSAVPDPPAAFYAFSRDRKGEHPERHLAELCWDPAGRRLCRVQRALTRANRRPGPMAAAACWSHARRKFFLLVDVTSKARALASR